MSTSSTSTPTSGDRRRRARSRRGAALACIGLALAVIAGTADAAAAADPVPTVEVSPDAAEGFSIDASGVTVPWMAQQLPDGSIEIRWGAIQDDLAKPAGTVLSSGLPAGRTMASFATLRVDCFLRVGGVFTLAGRLVSGLGATCTPGFGSVKAEYYFQYRKLLIWRRYSGINGITPTSTRSPANWNPSVTCLVGRGTHPYRLRARGYATAIGWGPWYNGPRSGDLNCGP